MAARKLLFAVAFFTAVSTPLFPHLTWAEDASSDTQDVETAKHNFVGVINGSNVLVRSAPAKTPTPPPNLKRAIR